MYVIPPFPFSNLNVRRGLKGLSVPNLGLLWISFLNIWLVVRFLLVCIIRKKACKQRKLIWTTYWAENYPNENEFMCHFRESLVEGNIFQDQEEVKIWKQNITFERYLLNSVSPKVVLGTNKVIDDLFLYTFYIKQIIADDY